MRAKIIDVQNSHLSSTYEKYGLSWCNKDCRFEGNLKRSVVAELKSILEVSGYRVEEKVEMTSCGEKVASVQLTVLAKS